MKPKKKIGKVPSGPNSDAGPKGLACIFAKKKLLFFIFPNPPAELLNVLNTPKWCQDGLNKMC